MNRPDYTNSHCKKVTILAKLTKIRQNSCKNENSIFDKLYPLLLKPEMYQLISELITDKTETDIVKVKLPVLDSDSIQSIIIQLMDESFQFTRPHSTLSLESKYSKNKLMISSYSDVFVQYAISELLEAIYGPAFIDQNFGVRPRLSPHNALQFIKLNYQNTRWFIQGDIPTALNEIEPSLIISILRRRIKDARFIRLIWKLLRAGCLHTNKAPKNCLLGVSSSSVLVNILYNIVLNEFDIFITTGLMPKYTRGKVKTHLSECNKLLAKVDFAQKRYQEYRGTTEGVEYLEYSNQVQKQLDLISSKQVLDSNLRRLNYVRYRGKWLIGFVGPKTEAEAVKHKCDQFLAIMQLGRNYESSEIFKGCDGCIYLGAKIHVSLISPRLTNKKAFGKSFRVCLNAPIDQIIIKLSTFGYCSRAGVPLPQMTFYSADKDAIVSQYREILHSFLTYYSFADNYKRLASTLFYILRGSAAKILAAKFKLRTVRQVLLKFGFYLSGENGIALPDFKAPRLRGRIFKLGRVNYQIPFYRKGPRTTKKV